MNVTYPSTATLTANSLTTPVLTQPTAVGKAVTVVAAPSRGELEEPAIPVSGSPQDAVAPVMPMMQEAPVNAESTTTFLTLTNTIVRIFKDYTRVYTYHL